MPIKRALISVSDKTGIAEFAKSLSSLNIEIISTGGTAKLLQDNNISVTEVSDFTGYPEMMAGRVKTLNPKIHGGILARRGKDEEVMSRNDIKPIDLVVVNLYPFQQTINNPNSTEEDAIENIDIGGPAMLRSSAKNHISVTVVVDSADYQSVIEEISKKRKIDPAETVLQLVEEEKGAVPTIVHNRVESDIRCFMDHPLAMFGSDGNAVSPDGFYKSGQPHPRFYGTYPRILSRYVREKPSVLSLEEAVYKMSLLPAQTVGIKNRGAIKKGMFADITIFDKNTIIDKATFENPHQYSEGIYYVLVNGSVAIDNGEFQNIKAGEVLRKNSIN